MYLNTVSSLYSFDHQAIKKYLLRPGRALINPFDPSHTEIRLTSNRRRWTHIFPKSSNNSSDIFPRNSESSNAEVLNMISGLHNVIPEDPDLDGIEGNNPPLLLPVDPRGLMIANSGLGLIWHFELRILWNKYSLKNTFHFWCDSLVYRIMLVFGLSHAMVPCLSWIKKRSKILRTIVQSACSYFCSYLHSSNDWRGLEVTNDTCFAADHHRLLSKEEVVSQWLPGQWVRSVAR